MLTAWPGDAEIPGRSLLFLLLQLLLCFLPFASYMRVSASALRHRVIWLNRRCSGEGGPSVKLVSFSKKITGQFFSSSEKRPNRRGEGGVRGGFVKRGIFPEFFFGTLPLLDVSSQLAAMVITSTDRL